MLRTQPTYITEKEIFPERLRTLMEETKTTQEDLGQALDVRRQTISLYITGQSKPDWKQVAKIAKFFNVSSDYLLGLSETRTTDIERKAICEYTGLSENAITSLNFIKQELGGPKLFRRSVLIDVLEDILNNPDHYGIEQHIWRAALAGIDFMRYSGEPISHRSDYGKFDAQVLLSHLDNIKKNPDGLSAIPSHDALLWYSNRAIDELTKVFTEAIQGQINRAISDILGDNKERFFTELKVKKGAEKYAKENDT